MPRKFHALWSFELLKAFASHGVEVKNCLHVMQPRKEILQAMRQEHHSSCASGGALTVVPWLALQAFSHFKDTYFGRNCLPNMPSSKGFQLYPISWK
jgi:hypothetical protein